MVNILEFNLSLMTSGCHEMIKKQSPESLSFLKTEILRVLSLGTRMQLLLVVGGSAAIITTNDGT